MEQKWMARAIALAAENARSGQGGPFGAVVVRGDEEIASGVNQVTSSLDPTAHAEVVAIRAACAKLGSFQLDGCEIYSSCEPCPMCLGAIYWARPSRVFFAASASDAAAAGFDDSFIYEQLPLPPDNRSIPMHQVMREEAQAAFRDWVSNPRRVEY
jgi:tRNA(Arg) A34 adenosine deaminase TadA